MTESLCEFPKTEYKTSMRRARDGDFVIFQSDGYEDTGTDIVMLHPTDAIAMALAILRECGEGEA